MVRVRDGEWLCKAPITFQTKVAAVELTPGATYRKGIRYKGMDVAVMLDDWLATGRLPPDVRVR